MPPVTTPQINHSHAGHETIRGHACRGQSDLAVLRAYFRKTKPPAAARHSIRSRADKNRHRQTNPLSDAQWALLILAEQRYGLSEHRLMDRLQRANLIRKTAIWLHEVPDAKCVAVMRLGPWGS